MTVHFVRDFFRPSDSVPDNLRQYVFVSNILGVVLFLLSSSLIVLLFFLYGWENTYIIIGPASLSYLAVIGIEKLGYYNASRVFFSLISVVFTLMATVFTKFETLEARSYLTFFDSRFILLCTTIIPGMIFRLDERVKFWTAIAFSFIGLMGFDVVHYIVGLDFYQLGFDVRGYYYINFIVFISFLCLLLGVVVLKSITENAERKYQAAISERESVNLQLQENNQRLVELNNEMEAQNEELHQQQEEISAGRDKLEEANRVIVRQQEKLMDYNTLLESKVEEKSRDLLTANEELVKHNNELRQFSYTVSHNLRGPVARLLGLTNLFNSVRDDTERNHILSLLQQSTQDLDAVLRDLNFIIDIRNDLYRVRERISFEQEWKKTLAMLGENMRNEYRINADFSAAPHVFGVKAMLQSILFNLLSNSVKYRSPERGLIIDVSTRLNDKGQTVLEFTDNGLGIDLRNQRGQVFKLYKRFHTHVSGKGLGLYLVKTQAEALSATVDIESEINSGTTFRLVFTTPPDLDKQVFFESEIARLYYDAYLNNTVVIWKKNITSKEYRRAFEAVLQTLKTYKTPGWIADLRNQGTVPDEDQLWFMNTVLAEAVRFGLKRIGAVGFKDPVRQSYYNRMIERTARAGVTLQVFETLEEASAWMQSFITDQK